MHEHVRLFEQNPTQKSWQKHKNPKNFQKLKPRSKKCMQKGEIERLRILTKGMRLGLGRHLQGRKDFGEKKGFGSR